MKATSGSMQASRKLRRNLSPPEAKLWLRLRGSPCGVRFRKQYAFGPYVADFYCPAARLAIEIDGLIHDYTADRDADRDRYAEGLGLRIVRIPASEVMANATAAADALIAMCAEMTGPSTTQRR